MRKLSSTGFTIIELLISTVILSMVLLTITSAIVEMSRFYYKSVIVSRTQETARTVIEDIAQSIQFAGANNTPFDNLSNCIIVGSHRYVYQKPNKPVTTNQHALIVDSGTTCSAPLPNLNSSLAGYSYRELLGENMRVVDLSVQQVGGSTDLYDITVRIAYGTGTDAQLLAGTPAVCKDNIRNGGQYCAVSALKMTVSKR
jgi:type II secretory pathway pseudopilin PulG